MPNNYIQLVLTSQRGASLFNAVGNYFAAKDSLALILANFQQMTDGVDYSTIEAAFGIPTGKGQAVNAMVTNALAELNAAANCNALVNQFAVTR